MAIAQLVARKVVSPILTCHIWFLVVVREVLVCFETVEFVFGRAEHVPAERPTVELHHPPSPVGFLLP